MKPLFLIGILLSAPSFAFDLSKLLTQQNLDSASAMVAQMAQAPKDRSCEALLNPEKRLQLWQFDQKMVHALMQLIQNQGASAVGDAADQSNAKTKLSQTTLVTQLLISQTTSLTQLLNESQQCLVKPLDWTEICSNSKPTLADQCDAKVELKFWVNQDWLCYDNTEQCSQKLGQLQTTQQASRQLAEWALDNASAIGPKFSRPTWEKILGLSLQ